MEKVVISKLAPYQDDNGNRIDYAGPVIDKNIQITFSGKNNHLIVDPGAQFGRCSIFFQSDDGICQLGRVGAAPHYPPHKFTATLFLHKSATIVVGDNSTSNGPTTLAAAAPDTSICLGSDCMLASNIVMHTTDYHPIFDIETKQWLNEPKSVIIEDHVWIANQVCILRGSTVGCGSVIGYGSLVKGIFPNNVTIAGCPAKVVRKNIVWERSHASFKAHNGLNPYWKKTGGGGVKNGFGEQ